jgi:hypothetical protein
VSGHILPFFNTCEKTRAFVNLHPDRNMMTIAYNKVDIAGISGSGNDGYILITCSIDNGLEYEFRFFI